MIQIKTVQWDGICEMRSSSDAPVDSLGAGKTTEIDKDPPTQRFQTLVSIIISSQTTDQQTSQAMTKLIEHGLTIKSIREIDFFKLVGLIKVVNANLNKAKFLKETAEILHNDYNDDVPRLKAEIMALPGCGKCFL